MPKIDVFLTLLEGNRPETENFLYALGNVDNYCERSLT